MDVSSVPPKPVPTTPVPAALTEPLDPVLIAEARLDPFPVTPLLAWDVGEVSGPHSICCIEITPEHLLLLVASLKGEKRLAFLKALEERGESLDWRTLQTELEKEAITTLRARTGSVIA